jgi:hypothetical protein
MGFPRRRTVKLTLTKLGLGVKLLPKKELVSLKKVVGNAIRSSGRGCVVQSSGIKSCKQGVIEDEIFDYETSNYRASLFLIYCPVALTKNPNCLSLA